MTPLLLHHKYAGGQVLRFELRSIDIDESGNHSPCMVAIDMLLGHSGGSLSVGKCRFGFMNTETLRRLVGDFPAKSLSAIVGLAFSGEAFSYNCLYLRRLTCE
jgi:hypothetical protein